MPLYPLKFVPRFVEKLWGGRKIETFLGKPLPPGKPVGESWELYDFPPGVVGDSARWISSPIANGPLAGRSLHSVVQEFGRELMGDVPTVGPHGQFPLLVKFLDAREDLSVQVHPDSAYASEHPEAHLKTEAWYIMAHDPGARLFKGLQPGVTRDSLRAAIEDGTVEAHLKSVSVRVGQCHYLPSGTLHALGAGILAAEVQTPSDTTFRVYDFQRIDPSTGRERTLHVEQAMQCINFEVDTLEAASSNFLAESRASRVTPLVSSPYFNLAGRHLATGQEATIAAGRPQVWIMIEGHATVHGQGTNESTPLSRGETLLVPAALGTAAVKAARDCAWLEVTFPACLLYTSD